MKPISPGTKTACIITAAGTSTRFSQGLEKKEYQLLEGKSLLAWSVSACIDSGVITHVVIVHPEGDRESAAGCVELYCTELEITFTAGGSTRQQSVLNGLEHLAGLGCDYVLIHDGARPWVTPECIREVLSAAVSFGGAAPVVPVSDAVKQVTGSTIIAHLRRSDTFGVQTPQGFEFPGILSAHRKAKISGKNYIDDTEVYSDYGGTVRAVTGDISNRKVTYREDIRSSI